MSLTHQRLICPPILALAESPDGPRAGRALNRYNAWAAGFLTPVGCHTWRATGITIYLEKDGRLEHEGTLCAMLHPEQ